MNQQRIDHTRNTLQTMPLTAGRLLQRKCACGQHTPGGGQCAACADKEKLKQPLQAKLQIGEANDSYEQEADRVADEVMRMPEPGLQGQVNEEELLRTKPLLQRRATADSGDSEAPSIVHEVLRSPGQLLDPPARAFMEPRFGHDFSRVRVHTDAKAVESARAVSALAYSVGRDIVFGAGQYAPGTRTGQRLLAHELTHVAQERGNQAVRRQPQKDKEKGSIAPSDCSNAHDAIMAWGLDPAVQWIRKNKAHKGRPAVVFEGEITVWKRFDKLHEVDIDIPFERHSQSPVEHVKWRVRLVRKNKQWILRSTITDWWDGNPMEFWLADGLTRGSGDHCVIEDAPSKPPPSKEKGPIEDDPRQRFG